MRSGFAAVWKPPGVGSQHLLARLRREERRPRLGHAGTLDPAAAGLLVVADGFARRLVDVAAFDKRYVAEIWLGLTTSTDDLTGEVLARQDASHLQAADVRAALAPFLGTIRQVPPRWSAVHVQGRRSYELARAGVAAEAPARTVTVFSWQLERFWAGPVAVLRSSLHVSSGTYVRALARDLGAALGVGGALAALLRTAVGAFTLETASWPGEPLAFADAKDVLPLPARALSDAEWQRLSAGQRIPDTDREGYVLGVHRGRTVALLEASDGELRPLRVAAEARP